MSIYQFANNASTTLGSSITPTATAITVASGTGAQFPALTAGRYFTATLFASATGIPNEIVRVTARVGDTMTVVRGQEGTTAQSWSVGDTFANLVTAGFLNQVADASSLQVQSGNYAVDSGTANVGVITLVPVPASLTALIGVPIRVKKSGAVNTGAYTLNVNAFGATAVLIGGRALEGGELVASEIYEVVYDGTQFNLISNPGTLRGSRLASNSVLNAALAQMGAATLKGNMTGAAAAPYDVPLSEIIAALGIITGGAVTTGNTSIHLSFPVQGLPSPALLQAGKVVNGTSNPIPCAFPVAFTTVVLGCGGIPYTLDTGGFSDQDGYIGVAGTPALNSLLFAVSRRGGDQHVDGCFWWAIGY